MHFWNATVSKNFKIWQTTNSAKVANMSMFSINQVRIIQGTIVTDFQQWQTINTWCQTLTIEGATEFQRKAGAKTKTARLWNFTNSILATFISFRMTSW